METMKLNYLLKQLKAALEYYEGYYVQRLDLTSGQCIMLNYLLSRKSQALYATDIHLAMGISKATISTILKSLKKKGYLIVEGDEEDDRRKKLVLTEKACSRQQEIEAALKKRGEDMCRGISGQELAVTEQVLEKMLCNLRRRSKSSEEESSI